MKQLFLIIFILFSSKAFADEFFILAKATCKDTHKINNKGELIVKVYSEVYESIKEEERGLSLLIDNGKRLVMGKTKLPSIEKLNKLAPTEYILEANSGVANYQAKITISSNKKSHLPQVKLIDIKMTSDYSDEKEMPENYNPLFLCEEQNVKIILMVLLFFGAFSCANRKTSNCQNTKTSFNCVKVVEVYDGDTIFIDLPGQHPLFGKRMGVRILGIDTPEIRTKDQCEKRKAKEAKKMLEKIITQAKRVDIVDIKKDKFFRILGRIVADGKSVSNELIKAKLAYPYHGERKLQRDWCY